MDTLDRFLVREFLSYFLVVWVGLAFLYLGIDFFSRIWELNMPVSKVFELYSYKIPWALQQFVSVASLMGTLFVLTSMSKQNEVLALFASGIGLLRLVSTLVALVALISAFSFLLFDSLVPTFSKKELLLSRGMDPSQEEILAFNRSGFWYRSRRLIYRVGQFLPQTNTLQDVSVFVLTPSFKLVRKIWAREAKFVSNDWQLRDGFTINYPVDEPFPVEEAFTTKQGIIPEKPSDFKTLQVEESTMELKELRKYIERNRSYGLDTTAQEIGYHERIAMVFTPLIFLLLGIPLVTKPVKIPSMAKNVGICFLIVFLYLLMFRTALSIGKGGHIPPVIAAWVTNVFFVIAGMVLIMRR